MIADTHVEVSGERLTVTYSVHAGAADAEVPVANQASTRAIGRWLVRCPHDETV